MRSAPIWSFVLAIGALGCASKGDTNVTANTGEERPTCASICRHLQAETFGDCASTKFVDYDDCVLECADHSPTEEGLTCMKNAGTCDDFRSCDSTYDIF